MKVAVYEYVGPYGGGLKFFVIDEKNDIIEHEMIDDNFDYLGTFDLPEDFINALCKNEFASVIDLTYIE